MATLDQLKIHVDKAKTEFSKTAKKAEDPKNDLVVRRKLKKVKRLERKVAKITAAEKMATSVGRQSKTALNISSADLTLIWFIPKIGSKFVGPEINVVSKPFFINDFAIS